MATPADSDRGTGDPFTKFWTDMFSRAAGASSVPGFSSPGFPPMNEEIGRQMRQAFFDSWSRACEEFMRTDAFLEGMKTSMDGALSFRQKVNEFLTKSLQDNQIPARADTESILLAVRRLEEKVLARLEGLTQRVEALEGHGGEHRGLTGVGSMGASSAPRVAAPAGKARTKGGARS